MSRGEPIRRPVMFGEGELAYYSEQLSLSDDALNGTNIYESKEPDTMTIETYIGECNYHKINGWQMTGWDEYSPLAVTQDGPGDFKSISTDFGPDVENDITFERDVEGFGLVTVSVPVSVLKAYMQAYDQWVTRND